MKIILIIGIISLMLMGIVQTSAIKVNTNKMNICTEDLYIESLFDGDVHTTNMLETIRLIDKTNEGDFPPIFWNNYDKATIYSTKERKIVFENKSYDLDKLTKFYDFRIDKNQLKKIDNVYFYVILENDKELCYTYIKLDLKRK